MATKVIHGDCRNVIPEVDQQFEMTFCDPPFGLDQPYEDFEDHFDDYEQFTKEWLSVAWAATKGVLCLHGPDKLATLFVDLEKELGFRDRRIAWVNWHYRFGQCHRSNWIDARCHCLIYAKTNDFTWNPESVLVQSDRVKYKDKRVHQTERGGKRLPGSVWGVPSDGPYWSRVSGTSKERWKSMPNQLPLRYLQRLVFAYTNEGDSILDLFAGSGGLGLVAAREGRNYVGIDVSEANCLSARERIEKGFYRDCSQEED